MHRRSTHHRRDLQGAGQGSCTSVANLISFEVERGHCAINLVTLHFDKLARKSKHHCSFGCFSSAAPTRNDRYTQNPRPVFHSQLQCPRCPQVMKAHSVNLSSPSLALHTFPHTLRKHRCRVALVSTASSDRHAPRKHQSTT